MQRKMHGSLVCKIIHGDGIFRVTYIFEQLVKSVGSAELPS